MSLYSPVGVSAAAYGNYVVTTASGPGGRILYNWWKLGGAANGWVELDGYRYTDAAPAASMLANAAINGYEFNPWSAMMGQDYNIYYNWWVLGGVPNGWVKLPGISTYGAITTALVGDYLFVLVVGTDNQIYVNLGHLGGPFTGWS